MAFAIVNKLNGDSTSDKQALKELVLFMLHLLDKFCCIQSSGGNQSAVKLKEQTEHAIWWLLKEWIQKPKAIGGTMFGVGGKSEAEINVGSIIHHH